MAEKLTDRTLFAGVLSDSDLIHIVDVSDTTNSAAGSSYKLTILQLLSHLLSVDSYTAFAGGGQASATALTSYDNNITTVATANDSVKLMSAVKNRRQKVRNNGANDLDIYPQTGQNFTGYAADAPFTLSPGGVWEFVCAVNGTYLI